MDTIDSISINFNPQQLGLLNLCLGFLVFGVALDLKIVHFKALIREPKAAVVGILSQLLMLPILTLFLIFIFQPPISIALGMALVAACPGGNVSNYAVHLAQANTALSITLTAVSTLAAILVTPLYFVLLTRFIPGTETISSTLQLQPLDMLWTMVELIVIPLCIGMGMAHQWPGLTNRIHRVVKGLSMAIFLGFVVVAAFSNWENIVNYLHLVFLIVFVHNTVALLAGYGFAKINHLSEKDARTVAIETGIQNSGLGLILIFNFFDGLGGMAMIAAWWGIWHLVSAFTLAMWWSRKGNKVQEKLI
ncbi:MAG: bile acid:sodium symporter family protein [Saprospiraceae bacterium]